MPALNVTKVALRKHMKEELKKITHKCRTNQSQAVVKKLFRLPIFKHSRRISVFLSTTSEIDTEPIVRRIFEDGKECFVPRYKEGCMDMVKLCSMEDWRTLPLTKWAIKQPSWYEKREDALVTGGLDLIIVPGVAFTREGLRLGHGGGYYDKYLSKIQKIQETPPTTVALAFKEQVLPDIPTFSHDVAIDVVLTAEDPAD